LARHSYDAARTFIGDKHWSSAVHANLRCHVFFTPSPPTSQELERGWIQRLGPQACGAAIPVQHRQIDDQPRARGGLRTILYEEEEEGLLVVDECADGDEVLDAVRHHRPELVVMDVRMSRMNGAEATRQLRERLTEPPPVLILTTFQDEEVLSSALRAGASGFLLKDAPREEIVRAVGTLAAGGAYLDPAVTRRALARYRQSTPTTPESTLPDLTQRELEVLRLVGRGLSNDEIA
jgi:DNA-binding NarL/FixJ family response regulator